MDNWRGTFETMAQTVDSDDEMEGSGPRSVNKTVDKGELKFETKLGEGAFGDVTKELLRGFMPVAVKYLKEKPEPLTEAEKMFPPAVKKAMWEDRSASCACMCSVSFCFAYV